ncbi:MAG: hypothetical protein HKM02_03875 [Pseudomonadales bacterium]|nr:hypothetical protein [Pseudomonadales bacterium]
MLRRTWLRWVVVVGTSLPLRTWAFLPSPPQPTADADPFAANSVENALQRLGMQVALPSNQIELDMPDLAEQGKPVSLTLRLMMPEIRKVAVLVSSNQTPLSALFTLSRSIEPKILLSVALHEHAQIIAVVQTKTQCYRYERFIRVVYPGWQDEN